MFNYNNINDIEFEELCKDIMSKKLGVELRSFSKGRDGGIDLKDNDSKESNNIIVQVKHYVNSNFNTLFSSLKKEVAKVKELNPKKYYICCSQELSPNNVKKIYALFKEYMNSEENIITLKEIQDFLDKNENINILQKHFKLWLESTNILSEIYNQNIFIDCEVLLSDIKEESKFYVKTNFYNDAIKILDSKNVLMLVGSPGVGKTITSKMLVLYYATKGYRVRYTTNGEIGEIKKSISLDKELKEIILLDDCLGQYYFKMKDTQENELLYLIKYIKTNPNKILILNSRITILNQAKKNSYIFNDFFESGKLTVETINIDNMSSIEKAKIFYNNLYFNEIPREYYNNIKENKNYIKIIDHDNYNPRIIEYVTKPYRYKEKESNQYAEYIFENLNNPTNVWEDEFSRRLSDIDRIFMLTLFSLTDTTVRYEVLEECFNNRLKMCNKVDTTINNFEDTLKRLSKSLIRIIDNNTNKEIGVLNPSINDYIKNIFYKNSLELNEIKKTIIYYEQIERCYDQNEINPLILCKFKDGSIFNLKINYNNPKYEDKYSFILMKIGELQIKYQIYKNDILTYIENIYKYKNNKINIIEYFLSEQLRDFYQAEECILSAIGNSKFINSLNISEIITLSNVIDKVESKQVIEKFLYSYIDNFDDILLNYMEKIDVYDYLSELDIDNYYSITINEEGVSDTILNVYEAREDIKFYIKDDLKELIKRVTNSGIRNLLEKCTDEINFNNFIKEQEIEEYLLCAIEAQEDYDYENSHNDHYNSDSYIDYIFK